MWFKSSTKHTVTNFKFKKVLGKSNYTRYYNYNIEIKYWLIETFLIII